MTVETEVASVSSSGNGATTSFAVPFPFFELVVETIYMGVVTLKEEGTHYDIVGGEGDTGSVEFYTPPSVGTTVRRRRVTSRLQATDYAEGDPFPAETHEQAMDRAHMILQEQAAHINKLRALAADYSTAPELTIASGVITPTGSYHSVDTQADAATDDLDTITATDARGGDVLILRAAHADRTVVIKNGTGNIILAEDRSMASLSDLVLLMYVEAISSWVEINGRPGPQGEQGDPGNDGNGTGDMVKATYDPTNINASPFARENHTGTQAQSTITGLETALGVIDAALDAIDTALDTKASTAYVDAEVTTLEAAIAGKANSSHTHATSAITGLDTALAARVSAIAFAYTGGSSGNPFIGVSGNIAGGTLTLTFVRSADGGGGS